VKKEDRRQNIRKRSTVVKSVKIRRRTAIKSILQCSWEVLKGTVCEYFVTLYYIRRMEATRRRKQKWTKENANYKICE